MRKTLVTKSGYLIPRSALALLLGATALLLGFYSFAADPPNGTLTETSGTLSYTSGPFLRSNPTPQVGVTCDEVFDCDHYGLSVQLPASFENTHNIVITVSWSNPAEDYDIYLREGTPPGTADIRDSASSSNPEIIVIDAKSGEYTIRTVPFAVAGGSTETTIELREKPPTPDAPTPGPGTPRFHNFAAPENMGNSAGEPTLAAGKPLAGQPGGRTMYIAGLETLRVTWDDCSSPAKPLWEDKSFATTSIVTLDPILFGDLETGRIQVSQLGPKTSFLAYTDDDGESYTPTQGSPVNPGVDHQTIGGGPYSPNLEPPHPAHPNAVYYASQDVAVAQLGRSDTGGLTYGPAVPMYNLTQCGGLHGHVKVTPRSPETEANGHVGTVYVPNKGCAGEQAVVVSEDNGTSFTVRQIPGSVAGPNDPSVGIDKGGKIYVAMSDGTGRAKVAVSADKGATWQTEAPIDVGAPFGIKNTVFPTAVGGDAGRATVMFLATQTGGDYQATDVFEGVWHIYAASTFDGGNTWTTVQVTPENDPVQRGSICTGGTTCGADRNLLDFNDMEIDHEGRIIMAYADGCIGCTDPKGSDSRAAKATIARQSGGKRMIAAFDPVEEPNAPASPLVTSVADDGTGAVLVDWEEPDNGGAAITAYKIFRRENTGAFGAPLATIGPAKTDYTDTTAVSGTEYIYQVTAVNSEGESAPCGEFPVGAAVDLGNVCLLPGLTKLTDSPGTGGTLPGVAGPGQDLLSMQLAQPYLPGGTDADILLVFTITTDPNPTGTQPAGTAYYVSFLAPDGNTRGVRMSFDAAAAGEPRFYSYLASESTGGQSDGRFFEPDSLKATEPDSNYDPVTGIITIVVKASDLAAAVNTTLTGFNSAVTVTSDPGGVGAGATATVDEMPNGLARSGSHAIAPNAACAPNSLPIAAIVATPRIGDAPLTVSFDAGTSSDPDAGDSVVSYTFNFGDGSAAVTQSSPTVVHTYNEAGVYKATVQVKDSKDAVSANTAETVIEVAPPDTAVNAKFFNISTRVIVNQGDNVGIAGFIIPGNQSKRVIIRGIGPTLQKDGGPFPGRLEDPRLDLYDGNTLLGSNDNWKESSNQAEIQDTELAPSDDREAAVVVTLDPGIYTAVLSGAGANTGVGLVEVYDLQGETQAQLANLSTRGRVEGGDNLLIGGFIIRGGNPQKFVFRAIGPSLTNKGVSDALLNPRIELRDSNGALLVENDDWRQNQNEVALTGLSPEDDREAAVVRNLGAGVYTAIVFSNEGTGTALVEGYAVGNP